MELLSYLVIVRRWFWLIVLSAVLTGGEAYVLTKRQPPSYSASTTLEIGSARSENPNLDIPTVTLPRELADTYIFILRTNGTLSSTIADLNLDMTPEALDKTIQVRAQTNTALFTITASNEDPVMAAKIADTLASELIVHSPTTIAIAQQNQIKVIQAEVDNTRALLASLRAELKSVDDAITSGTPTSALSTRRNEVNDRILAAQTVLNNQLDILLKLQAANNVNTLTVVAPAVVPTTATGPSVALNTILGIAVGLIFVLGVVFVVEYLADTIQLPSEVELLLGLPLIGMITPFGRRRRYNKAVITLTNSHPAIAEAYRITSLNLLLANKGNDGPHLRYVMTSPNPDEGTSINAANLAATFAQTNMRVLLIDANLRHPTQHQIFALNNEKGLSSLCDMNVEDAAPVGASEPTENSDVTQAEDSPVSVDRSAGSASDAPGPVDTLPAQNEVAQWVESLAQTTEIPNLNVITTGPVPSHQRGFLDLPQIRQFMEGLADNKCYDVILIDSPALLPAVDTALIANLTGAEVILLLAAGKTRRTAAVRAKRYLEGLSIPVVGIILNRLDPLAMEVGYARPERPTQVPDLVTPAP
ncbi:MAG TPA: Wzz/FepE/Etk N-terminal domain-containing protein, partial [Aggregatilineaceae bacterium]|nr:Wzz/FepE/Etk N-terminal domain-containing protein [Aggregatilineaceae bacterium]